jgi:hypothetical protein
MWQPVPERRLRSHRFELSSRGRSHRSWENPIFPLMKEDDPLLRTALAVVALGAAEE